MGTEYGEKKGVEGYVVESNLQYKRPNRSTISRVAISRAINMVLY